MNKKPYWSLLIVLLGLAKLAAAQDTVLTVTYSDRLDSLNSAILQQKRYIQVFLPADYTPGSPGKYDVLYVLDGGNWNTGLITRIQRFVEDQGHIPPTIIVSVMGIDRNVELTPTHLDSWKGSGGGEKFLGYITKELIPHIDSTYPTNGDNVSGREGQLHDMRIDTLETVLKTSAPPGLNWKIVPYKEETHSSVRLKTTYDGLKFTYAGLVSDIQFAPDSGILLKDSPARIWYFDDTARMHYTLDGTTPTEASPRVRHGQTGRI